MPDITLGTALVGAGRPTFVIAEIGINHNGSLDTAKRLIDAALDAGCDAVKFQKRTVDVVYTPEELANPRPNPFGETNGDLKRGLELGPFEYGEIDRHCRQRGILWTASCWDEGSVDFIDGFAPAFYKIASASLTDDDLLRHTRRTGRPILLSTGMSTLEETDHAVRVLGPEGLVLLHTCSTYPSKDEDLNLRTVPLLRERYDVPVGYSGHEAGIAPSLAAVALGACVIERHLTLDRTMWGSDQSASLEPHAMAEMVRGIRSIEAALGDGVKRVLDAEVPIMRKLRRVGVAVAA